MCQCAFIWQVKAFRHSVSKGGNLVDEIKIAVVVIGGGFNDQPHVVLEGVQYGEALGGRLVFWLFGGSQISH